ncbi:MAG TPA: asparagine synthase-related protein [Vicinamibacterales bacterium]|nr:asparagine synthase-related protein [Vicinamibacterales bacterium]
MLHADRTVSWTSDPGAHPAGITLFQSSIATAPEDDFSSASGVTSDGTIHLVADVRLDNRSALGTALGIANLSSTSDESLILAAYKKWGFACTTHLRGDFAFIVWDGRQGHALACRDPLGVRALAFARDTDGVIIASTIGAVLAALTSRPRPNLEYLRRFVDGSDAFEPGATAYDGIAWVPPGYQAELRNGTLTLTRYAELGPQHPFNGTVPDAFAEFKRLLTIAVERRLRAKHPVGFMLSGGFDSSAVVCAANASVEAGRSHAELRSYSAVYDRFPEADDRPYLTSVIASCNRVTATLLPWDDQPWTLAKMDGRDGFPLEHPVRGPRSFAPLIAKRAALDGCRVMVSGLWADQLLFGSPYALSALLWDLPPGRIVKELRHFSAQSTAGGLLRSLVAAAWRRWNTGPALSAPGTLLRQRFVHGRHAEIMTDAARTFKWVGTENRLPFLDRDLLEFVMSLRSECFFEGGRSKRLLREGMADLLPHDFQDRQHVAFAGRFVFAAMKAERDQIAGYFDEPLIVERGIVTLERVRSLLARLWSDDATGPIPEIQRLVAAEIWLRNQERESTTRPSVASRVQNATRSDHNKSGVAS